MQIGETIQVSYEESKKLRKEGWKPRNDVVVMMYVGQSENPISNRSRADKKHDPASLVQTPAAIRMREMRAARRAEAGA